MPKRIPPLTDLQISKARPKNKDYKLADGSGMYLLVTVSGGKLWRYDYRFAGKRKTISFGAYSVVTLADARQCRIDAQKLLKNLISTKIQNYVLTMPQFSFLFGVTHT